MQVYAGKTLLNASRAGLMQVKDLHRDLHLTCTALFEKTHKQARKAKNEYYIQDLDPRIFPLHV